MTLLRLNNSKTGKGKMSRELLLWTEFNTEVCLCSKNWLVELCFSSFLIEIRNVVKQQLSSSKLHPDLL